MPTKFAVVGRSQSLRDELSPHGIGVLVLCPGFVKTHLMAAQRNAPPDLARRGMWASSTLTGPQAESMQMLTAEVENGADPQHIGLCSTFQIAIPQNRATVPPSGCRCIP